MTSSRDAIGFARPLNLLFGRPVSLRPSYILKLKVLLDLPHFSQLFQICYILGGYIRLFGLFCCPILFLRFFNLLLWTMILLNLVKLLIWTRWSGENARAFFKYGLLLMTLALFNLLFIGLVSNVLSLLTGQLCNFLPVHECQVLWIEAVAQSSIRRPILLALVFECYAARLRHHEHLTIWAMRWGWFSFGAWPWLRALLRRFGLPNIWFSGPHIYRLFILCGSVQCFYIYDATQRSRCWRRLQVGLEFCWGSIQRRACLPAWDEWRRCSATTMRTLLAFLPEAGFPGSLLFFALVFLNLAINCRFCIWS